MFSQGTRDLIDGLPELDGLNGSWVRRRLSLAYVEVLAARELLTSPNEDPTTDVRRLVNALELYVLNNEPSDTHFHACAFVAAEGAELGADQRPGEENDYPRLEAALLFAAAGFDANAAAAIRRIADMRPDESPRGWALEAIRDLVLQRGVADIAFPERVAAGRREALLDEMWRRVGLSTRAHQSWLKTTDDWEASPGLDGLAELRTLIGDAPNGESRYAAVLHIADLLYAAMQSTQDRAVKRLVRQEAMRPYVEALIRTRPLLWPGAKRYAAECLGDLDKHAVISVPTGSGKSAIAELAVARAAEEGWTLYLAPTNALVGQIRRDLRRAVNATEGRLRTFAGGGEYTTEEPIQDVTRGDVFVMTPEKCALALRQSPEVFESLRLLVVDECHLIGASGSRGVVVELVVAEILERTQQAVALMMSALVANAEELASWLRSSTGKDALAIRDPWRPTRTMRGIVGLDREAFLRARSSAEEELERRPNNVARENPGLAAIVGLQGAWDDTEQTADFVALELPARVEAQFRTTNRRGEVEGWRNRAAESLTRALADAGEHVLTFVPANKHEVFGVARAVAHGQRDLGDVVDSYITLAEYELGSVSEVGVLLRGGVATHSGALIDDERRASEVAFAARDEGAPVMVATTSLAQGLNLPATVVVVAGTRIGQGDQGAARTARDLLNAIGRAGRPFIANRSLALVIPSDARLVARASESAGLLGEAPFLGDEDAAVPLESQLTALLRRDADRLASLDAMTEEELAAFTYLPLSEAGELASRILRRTFGQYQRRDEIGPVPEETAPGLAALGRRFLEAGEAPAWLVRAAYVSGIDLRGITGLYQAIMVNPVSPTSVSAWAEALLGYTRTLPRSTRELLLNLDNVPDPLKRDLRNNDDSAWRRISRATTKYLSGSPVSAVAEAAFEVTRDDGRRSGIDPLPKGITLIRDLFSYRLSMTAGALDALMSVAADNGHEIAIEDEESRARLSELPLALRLGCGSRDARLWGRYGVGRRRLAHALGKARPVPEELTTESRTREWMTRELLALAEDADAMEALDVSERGAIIAAASLG